MDDFDLVLLVDLFLLRTFLLGGIIIMNNIKILFMIFHKNHIRHYSHGMNESWMRSIRTPSCSLLLPGRPIRIYFLVGQRGYGWNSSRRHWNLGVSRNWSQNPTDSPGTHTMMGIHPLGISPWWWSDFLCSWVSQPNLNLPLHRRSVDNFFFSGLRYPQQPCAPTGPSVLACPSNFTDKPWKISVSWTAFIG